MREEQEDAENLLGSLEKDVLDVRNVQLGMQPPRPDQPFIFSITDRTQPNIALNCACESKEDLEAWMEAITQAALSLSGTAPKYVPLHRRS